MKHILFYMSIFLVWSCLNSCGDRSNRNEVNTAFEEIVFGVRLVEDSSMIEKINVPAEDV